VVGEAFQEQHKLLLESSVAAFGAARDASFAEQKTEASEPATGEATSLSREGSKSLAGHLAFGFKQAKVVN
jgi:hypothetical protein